MKIAIPTKQDQVDNHFGHCDFFTIFELNEQFDVIGKEKLEAGKVCGCKSNLTDDLVQKGVNLLLAGGIGEGAIRKLNAENIEVIAGFNGNIETAVETWKRKDFSSNFTICTEHDECSH